MLNEEENAIVDDMFSVAKKIGYLLHENKVTSDIGVCAMLVLMASSFVSQGKSYDQFSNTLCDGIAMSKGLFEVEDGK